jgi:hypothetical protein
MTVASAIMSQAQPATRWWKGNLHTHTLWSDGDDFPEMVVDWYKSRGYDFLALSDHNTLQEGAVGVVATNAATLRVMPRYVRRFGSNWVKHAESTNGAPLILLRTLPESSSSKPRRSRLISATGRFT